VDGFRRKSIVGWGLPHHYSKAAKAGVLILIASVVGCNLYKVIDTPDHEDDNTQVVLQSDDAAAEDISVPDVNQCVADARGVQVDQTAQDKQLYLFPAVDELPFNKGLPNLFVMQDGSYVETKEDWEKQRDYLKAMLEHYQYGHMPPKAKDIAVKKITPIAIYGGEAIQIKLEVAISRKGKEFILRMGILRPNKPGKFPVIIKNDEFLFDVSEIKDLEIRRIYEGRREEIEEFVRREIIKRGYVFCKFIRTDIALDEIDNRRTGAFVLYPEYDWGTIAAWAWGYKIALDVLEREPFVDMGKVAATGHARGGKAALCAGIYDESIDIIVPHVSGSGGTGSWRYFDPNRPPRGLAVVKEFAPHFWVPRIFSFVGREDRLPFDAHYAKALIAPRVLLNTHVRGDYGANPYGTYLTFLAARPVFNLLKVGQNCLIHWRDGSDHNQSEEDWLTLFELCDKVFFGKDMSRQLNDNPFAGLYRFDVLRDVNTGGITALHHAVERGHKVAELLIANGVDVNAKDEDGNTPLHYAVRLGRSRKDIIKLLIENGVDINAKNNDGQTPVDVALSRNRNEFVELLIEEGADVSLDVAARFGVLTKVKSLIEKGTDINEKDVSGKAALHYAVEYGNKDVVEWLIDNGADVNVEDNDRNTPGHVALGEDNRSILELLIANGANLDSIHLSAYQGDLDKVRSFLKEGTDVNAVDSYGATPLHYAARRGSKEVVEFLIVKGADVDVKDKRNLAPLHVAAAHGHTDVVALLIDNAADIYAKGQWGYTPIYYAAWSEVTEVVELLLEKGVDVNTKDKWGGTPLHYMVSHSQRC